MVNPLNEAHLKKAVSLDCDILTLNLEDGIAPSQKQDALEKTIAFLHTNKDAASRVCVRINDGALNEIKALNIAKPFAIRLPKVQSKDDLSKALEVLDDDIELHFTVETISALNGLSTFKIDNRVKVCYLGILDLANDFGLSHKFLTITNPMVGYIESKFLFDAASAGLQAFAPIYQNYKDLDGLKTWCEFEQMLGFKAKGAISVSQLTIINDVFKSKNNEKAQYIIKRFEEMRLQGVTGFVDELYGFIDEPIYKNALLEI